MVENQNILVTGVPRSGTTLIGRIIAFSNDVNYIWEPFNLKYRCGIPDYYPYSGKETNDEKRLFYDNLIKDTIRLKNLKPVITVNPGDSIIKRIVKKMGINRTTFWWYRWPQIKKLAYNPPVSLFKDPIGIFLCGHLVSKYNFKIIVAVRHPAAVTSSRKNLEWHFDFNWWKNQKDLYDAHFKKIETILMNYDMDIITETAFHWLTCYSYVQKLKDIWPDRIMMVRHEDVCENPVGELEKVFKWLGLRYDNKIITKIKEITTGDKLEKSTMTLATLEKRDAKNLIYKWKPEISQDQLDRIREITKSVSSAYYSENEWLV